MSDTNKLNSLCKVLCLLIPTTFFAGFYLGTLQSEPKKSEPTVPAECVEFGYVRTKSLVGPSGYMRACLGSPGELGLVRAYLHKDKGWDDQGLWKKAEMDFLPLQISKEAPTSSGTNDELVGPCSVGRREGPCDSEDDVVETLTAEFLGKNYQYRRYKDGTEEYYQ